jgi:hypothetical protein
METRLFAVIDETTSAARRIKIVRLTQAHDKWGFRHTLTAYQPESEPYELVLTSSSSDDPDITELTLSTGGIHVWRTGLTVNHKGVWLQVLDSDKRQSLPGDYIFSCLDEIPTHFEEESQDDTPSSQPIQQNIPQFVAEIMKRDAISAKASCAISLESLAEVPISITSCFHMFDSSSINKWLQRENSCPVCKSTVSFVQPV